MTQKLWNRRHVQAAAITLVASGSAAAAGPVPPMEIGANISSVGGSHTFANLAFATNWLAVLPAERWKDLPPEYLDEQGELKLVPPGGYVLRVIQGVDLGRTGVTINCTYRGTGDVTASGPSGDGMKTFKGGLSFHWGLRAPGSVMALKIASMDPADPIRKIDCRKAGDPTDTLFAPELSDIIKGFKVLRFMDWQNMNANLPAAWATRHKPGQYDLNGGDGVPLEYMVTVATANGSDPWFCMPWNADDDYIRNFARYVHDALPRTRKVYVESANEVWNWGFPVSRQAMKEGQDAHLSDNPREASLRRQALRIVHVMDIWAEVFADDPRRLVRVAASQHADPSKSDVLLGYGTTAKHIDALATAPYIDYDHHDDPSDLDTIFGRLEADVDRELGLAAQQKAIAAKYGKRYITYEGGQGVVLPNAQIDLARKVQRDPRMYTLYKRFLEGWRTRVGDTLMLYNTVFVIRASGGWGLIEHDGQPLLEAPKLRAVREEMAQQR